MLDHKPLFPAKWLVTIDGDQPNRDWTKLLDPHAVVVAADGGARHALGAHRHIDHVVGDLDSVSPSDLELVVSSGGQVHRYPRVKDETDFELALEFARSLASNGDDDREESLLVIGGSGGRIDHFAANLAVLAAPTSSPLRVYALMGNTLVTVVRPESPSTFTGPLHSIVTLLAINGTVSGVTTQGLTYPLDDEPLSGGSARGISNTMSDTVASVSIAAGVLLAFQPDVFRTSTTKESS